MGPKKDKGRGGLLKKAATAAASAASNGVTTHQPLLKRPPPTDCHPFMPTNDWSLPASVGLPTISSSSSNTNTTFASIKGDIKALLPSGNLHYQH
jgi:hypothetical protein